MIAEKPLLLLTSSAAISLSRAGGGGEHSIWLMDLNFATAAAVDVNPVARKYISTAKQEIYIFSRLDFLMFISLIKISLLHYTFILTTIAQ